METNIIKFGGSVITDTSSKEHFNKKNTVRLARELYPHHKNCVLVHGTGHIGKPPAILYGYLESGVLLPSQYLAALNIKSALRRLNQRFVDVLLSENIPAIPIDILQFYGWPDFQLDLPKLIRALFQLLDRGLVPVFYGDLLPQSDGSFIVFSSDLITLILAKNLNPLKVIFLSDVEGVYADTESRGKANPKILKVLSPQNFHLLKKMENDKQDVSGGMLKKAKLALEVSQYCESCFIGSGYRSEVLNNLFTGEKEKGTFVI
ncbi:MAG: hypothetical protein H6573_35280 [Lewinellaceae bacterium]|nr:hypothetical protein [Lewinellaceae bacterium]